MRWLGLPGGERQPPSRPRIADGIAGRLQRGIRIIKGVQRRRQVGAYPRVGAKRRRGTEQRHLAPASGLTRRGRAAGLHHKILTHGPRVAPAPGRVSSPA